MKAKTRSIEQIIEEQVRRWQIMRTEEKKEEDINENRDVSLLDFLSQEAPVEHFVQIKTLLREFKDNFLQSSDEDINTRWLGRSLKRLGLIVEKRRRSRGMEVRIDYNKAQEKIRMFK